MTRRLPIRIRVTLAFAGAMAVLLSVIGVVVYQLFEQQLDETLNQGLRSRAGDVSALIQSDDTRLDAPSRSVLVQRGESFAQILDPHGRVLDASPQLPSQSLLSRDVLERTLATTSVIVEQPNPFELGEPARLLATPVKVGDRQVVVVVGVGADDRNSQLRSLAVLLLIAGPVALILASFAGFQVASAALRPVEAMRRTAEEITEEDPGARLPIGEGDDEITQLGTTLNRMLARLEQAMARERAFAADASHELRTPVSNLRTEIELALRGERTAAELRAALVSASEETQRLEELADTLLVLARADGGQLYLNREPVDALELLTAAGERFAATLRGLSREVRVDGTTVDLLVDRVRIDQALDNLLQNAVRHGRGRVDLLAIPQTTTVQLRVRDNGPGLPDDFIDSAFERFTRSDPGRTGGGVGLGLSIVDAIARAHDGTVHVANVPGAGADFCIELPKLLSSEPVHPG